jgi:hypothetical protein
MYVPTYNPATDDLYTYDGTNSGWPTGWNPSHPLYSYRSQLAWIGVRSRSTSLAQSGGDLLYTKDNNAGAAQPLAQKPNWFNPRLPSLAFVAPRLAIGAIHYWDGVTNRARPATVGLGYLDPIIKTMDADGTLRTFANAHFRGTWNQNPSGTYRGNQDCGYAELELGDAHPGPFPTMLRVHDRTFTAQPAWLIEGNGRAWPMTLQSPGYVFEGTAFESAINPNLRLATMDLEPPAGADLYVGDSGGILILISDGVVYALGHVTYDAEEQVPWANTIGDPDVAHLASLGHTITVTSFGIDYDFALETTLQASLAEIEEAIDALGGA